MFIANIVHIDINNFTILGQTLGADTALQCYKSMPDVFKLYCTIDATFFWAWEDINSSKFKITKPILMLYSERYYKFKGDECFKDYDPQILNDKLFGNNKNKKSYNVWIDSAVIYNQTDMALYYHNTYRLFSIILNNVDVLRKYEETIKYILTFMTKNDSLPVRYEMIGREGVILE